MLLQFITEPTISAKERRLIRSHVMQGKNAGKPRIARTKLTHRDLQHPSTPKANAPDVNGLMELDSRHALSLHRLLWNDVSLTTYPYSLSSETQNFVYQRTYAIPTSPPRYFLPANKYLPQVYGPSRKPCIHPPSVSTSISRSTRGSNSSCRT
jgi:hypothetical protein